MLKEVIYVPKDKNPLDELFVLGNRVRESWIFLHSNAIKKFKNSTDIIITILDDEITLNWPETDDHPEIELVLNSQHSNEWKSIEYIFYGDSIFKKHVSDPNELFFIKMDM